MNNDFILVLDLGGTMAVDMARKLRNQRYYTEIMSRSADLELFKRKSPRGVLVVGGGTSQLPFPRPVLQLGVPVLALGSAARHLIACFGATSQGVLLSEQATQITFEPCLLFDGLSESDRYFRRVEGYDLPQGFRSIATTMEGYSPAFSNSERQLYGLQFYPESNDPDGAAILTNFAEKICGCTPMWSIDSYIEEELRFIRERVGDSRALCAVSGGVDSTTCALLMKRAIGDRLTCVFIDTGLLRIGEAEQVYNSFDGELALPLIRVNARERMLECLRGLADPVEKQQAIYAEYMAILGEVAQSRPDITCFVEGTIYSDLLKKGASDGVYARRFEPGARLEPIRMLFKDEVRLLGRHLGLPDAFAAKPSFPGTGLALRCVGEVTAEKLELLRRADRIFEEEIVGAGQDKRLTQFFALLDDTKVFGMRDAREYVCVLRAVSEQGIGAYSVGRLPYDLLEGVSDRILREVPGIGRVTYDISPGLWAGVEWE